MDRQEQDLLQRAAALTEHLGIPVRFLGTAGDGYDVYEIVGHDRYFVEGRHNIRALDLLQAGAGTPAEAVSRVLAERRAFSNFQQHGAC